MPLLFELNSASTAAVSMSMLMSRTISQKGIVRKCRLGLGRGWMVTEVLVLMVMEVLVLPR